MTKPKPTLKTRPIRLSDELYITDKGRTQYKELHAIGYTKLPYQKQREEFELLCILDYEQETTPSYVFNSKVTELGRKLAKHPEFRNDYARALKRLEKRKFVKIVRKERKKRKEE